MINFDNNEKIILNEILETVNDSELGSMKSVIIKLIELMSSDLSTSKDLEKVIQLDPPLSASILRVANSAFYRSRRKISSLEDSIVWLGFNNVKEIALNQKIQQAFKGEKSYIISPDKVWNHSLRVAIFARKIYKKSRAEEGNDAYTMGLLHDIGLIVLAQLYPRKFKEINKRIKGNPSLPLIDVEKEVMGVTHPQIGYMVTVDWKLPENISISILQHHEPKFVNFPENKKCIATLYLSDYMCQSFEFGEHLFEEYVEKYYNNATHHLKMSSKSLKKTLEESIEEFNLMKQEGIV